MDASLDTNVIIHLYNADFQDLLFNRFEKLKVYEFIRTQELKKHADPEVLEIFDKDVESGEIELVTDTYLREIGMFNIFLAHVKDTRILFEGSDLGEVYAISMAKTLNVYLNKNYWNILIVYVICPNLKWTPKVN